MTRLKVVEDRLNPKTLMIGLAFVWVTAMATQIPEFIQWGDSSEFVTAAQESAVLHPPGFPLYNWFNIALAQMGDLGSTAFRLGAGTLASVVFFILILLLRFNPNNYFSVGILIYGLTHPLFLIYSVTPEVFSWVIAITGLWCLFILEHPDRQKPLILLFLTIATLSHHPTLVFLAPLPIYHLFQMKKLSKSVYKSVLAIIFAMVASASIYLSQLHLNTESYFSWGFLKNAQDIWNHFLRADYGTLSLSMYDQGLQLKSIALNFSKKFTPLLIVTTLLCGFTGSNKPYRPKILSPHLWILMSFVLYFVVFFSLARLSPEGDSATVLRRFYLLPMILLWITALSRSNHLLSSNRIVRFLISIALIWGIWDNFYRYPLISGSLTPPPLHEAISSQINTSLLHELSSALFRESLNSMAPITVVDSDTEYFSLRFQQSLNKNIQSCVITLPLLTHEWMRSKVAKYCLPLNLQSKGYLDVDTDFLSRETLRHFVFSTFSLTKRKDLHVKYGPWGRTYQLGHGETILPLPQFKPMFGTTGNHDDFQFEFQRWERKLISPYLVQGRLRFQNGESKEALSDLKAIWNLSGQNEARELACQIMAQTPELDDGSFDCQNFTSSSKDKEDKDAI